MLLWRQTMMAKRDRVFLIECFVDFLAPRVRSAFGRHHPQNNPVDGEPQDSEDYQNS